MAKLENTKPREIVSQIAMQKGVIFIIIAGAFLTHFGILDISLISNAILDFVLALPQAQNLTIIGLVVSIVLVTRRYGRFEASIREPLVQRGDEFHFQLEQAFRFRTHVRKVSVFLVYRVMIDMPPISSGEGGEYIQQFRFDRLIDQSEQEGGIFRGGWVLSQSHPLRIPALLMSPRHPFSFKRPQAADGHWVIKIRFQLASGRIRWREFKLVTDYDPHQPHQPIQKPTDDMFDLYCLSVPRFSTPGARAIWSEAVPHGLWGFNAGRPEAPSFYVLEQRSRAEVEAAKAQLEKTGATLEIRPSE